MTCAKVNESFRNLCRNSCAEAHPYRSWFTRLMLCDPILVNWNRTRKPKGKRSTQTIFFQKNIFRHRLCQIKVFGLGNHVVKFFLIFADVWTGGTSKINFRKIVSQQLLALTNFDLLMIYQLSSTRKLFFFIFWFFFKTTTPQPYHTPTIPHHNHTTPQPYHTTTILHSNHTTWQYFFRFISRIGTEPGSQMESFYALPPILFLPLSFLNWRLFVSLPASHKLTNKI